MSTESPPPSSPPPAPSGPACRWPGCDRSPAEGNGGGGLCGRDKQRIIKGFPGRHLSTLTDAEIAAFAATWTDRRPGRGTEPSAPPTPAPIDSQLDLNNVSAALDELGAPTIMDCTSSGDPDRPAELWERPGLLIGRWQQAIYEKVCASVPEPHRIDGAGSDGDELALTLAEVSQGLTQLQDLAGERAAERDEARRERDEARAADLPVRHRLAPLLGIGVEEDSAIGMAERVVTLCGTLSRDLVKAREAIAELLDEAATLRDEGDALDSARAEVAALRAERAQHERIPLSVALARAAAREAELVKERDEARAEVARLHAEFAQVESAAVVLTQGVVGIAQEVEMEGVAALEAERKAHAETRADLASCARRGDEAVALLEQLAAVADYEPDPGQHDADQRFVDHVAALTEEIRRLRGAQAEPNPLTPPLPKRRPVLMVELPTEGDAILHIQGTRAELRRVSTALLHFGSFVG